jgi:hypothetical protein
MSTHLVPITVQTTIDDASRVYFAGRAPSVDTVDGPRTDGLTIEGVPQGTNVVFVYTPDLSPAESTLFTDYVASVRWNLPLTVYQARKADYALVASMMPIASPTAVQSREWLRAISRIVNSMLDRE